MMRATSFGRVWRDQALSEPTLYFGYGSNLNSVHFAEWLTENTNLKGAETKLEKVSNAYLNGYRLGFTRKAKSWNAGVADVVEVKGERVWGVVFRPTPSQWIALDQKEGVKIKAYKRHEVRVFFEKETPVSDVPHPCTTYVVVKKEGCLQAPHPEYSKIIEDGGREHRLPDEFFEHLEIARVTERNPVAI